MRAFLWEQEMSGLSSLYIKLGLDAVEFQQGLTKSEQAAIKFYVIFPTVKIPSKRVSHSIFTMVGYTDPSVADEFDKPTTDPKKDKCSHCIRGCKLRWGDQPLPFSGFPSTTQYGA